MAGGEGGYMGESRMPDNDERYCIAWILDLDSFFMHAGGDDGADHANFTKPNQSPICMHSVRHSPNSFHPASAAYKPHARPQGMKCEEFTVLILPHVTGHE